MEPLVFVLYLWTCSLTIDLQQCQWVEHPRAYATKAQCDKEGTFMGNRTFSIGGDNKAGVKTVQVPHQCRKL